jgi:hypothetical protein
MVMNRRNFFGIAPVGIAAVAALARGEQAEQLTEIKKAKTLTITGPNGEEYHPLVVEKNEVQYASVEPPKPMVFMTNGQERFRLS